MPREVRTQVDVREVMNPISRPQATQVVARPVSQLELQAPDPELMGLIQGLSDLSPKLQQYAYASRFSRQKEEATHMQQGAADAAQGKEMKPGSPEYYQHGYMVQRGQVGADEAGQAYKDFINTGFDWDTGDIHQATKEFFAKDTKGITDKSYLEGYNSSILKHIEQVQGAVQEYRGKAVIAQTESDFLSRMSGAMRSYVDNGMPVPVEVLDAFRNEGKSFFGINAARFNDLRFTAVKSLADEGNPDLFNLLKQKPPGGAPAMYDMPEWKPKIDAGIIHATNISFQKSAAVQKANKEAREDKQDEALYSVFLKLQDDPEGARQDYENLRKSGLFSRASDLFEWDTKFASASKKEASATQQDLENKLLPGIYNGTVRPQEIMQADITPVQKRSLMGEWYRVKNDSRQAAASGQKAADAIYKTQQFDTGRDYIRTVLRPQASPLDPMGIGTEFARMQLASAEREYIEAARKVKDPSELYGIHQEIANRYLTRAKDPRIKKELEGAGFLRYSTPQELQEAVDRGDITDPADLRNQILYFKSLAQKP